MKPKGLKSKIFLDSGDPAETKSILDLLGFLDGQTTNPTLVVNNPYAQQRFDADEKFLEVELYGFYKKVITEIAALLPNGSVSIEVFADHTTTADQMFTQGKEMFGWVPNAHVKYPIIPSGLKAVQRSIQEKMRVNMTLCFSQEQAAAVYSATAGAKPGDVFVSPFVGRLDDVGENGMSLVDNVLRMYKTTGDHHVQVLAASIRSMEHFMQSLELGTDIITAPFSILEQWAKAGMPVPDADFVSASPSLAAIPYRTTDLNQSWSELDICHSLTDKGVDRFAQDWNKLIG